MPQEHIDATAELDRLLDSVCQRYAMASREQALEFLLKRRLRKAAQRVSGRGRALYPVRSQA